MSLATEPAENVLRMPPFTEAAALAWLRERGKVYCWPLTGLGEQWGGWPKSKVHRYLEKWLKHKFIRYQGAGKKRMVVYLKGAPAADAVLAPALPAASRDLPAPPAVPARVSAATEPRPGITPELPAATVAIPVSAPAPAPVAAPRPSPPAAAIPNGATATSTVTIPIKLLAFLIFLIGASFAAGSLWLNGTSWHSFASASNEAAGIILAGFGLAIGALAILSPSAATFSPTRGLRAMFLALGLVAMAIEAAVGVGFMFANIGSAVGSREAMIEERTRVAEQIAALETERDGWPKFERTSPAQVAAATATRVRECQRGGGCSKAIAAETKLGADLTRTDRADAIKIELASLESRRKILPFIAAADPLITGLIEVVTWMSAGSWAPSERTIRNIRLLIFAFAASVLPGPIIAGALGLVRR